MSVRQHIESRLQIVAWLAVGLAGGILVALAYPAAFPFAPQRWEITRSEAIAIALARLSDLSGGEVVRAPFVVASFTSDPGLELWLLESLRELDGEGDVRLRSSRLIDQVSQWTVLVYPRGARPGEWDYRVQVTPDGRVVALQRRLGETASGTLDLATAREQAAGFLRQQGIDLDRLGEPVERRVEQVGRHDLVLRYSDREVLGGDALSHGVEVRFAGDTLSGFFSWYEDADDAVIAGWLRVSQLLETGWILASFLLLPFVTAIFVRRYHEGLLGVRRATQIFGLVLFACALVLLATLHASSEGSSFGTLTRQQMTWVWAVVMLLVYYPTIALMAFFGWSVGESVCLPQWRQKLASFDALMGGQWRNATVASSAFRGAVLALLEVGVVLAALLLLGRIGARSTFAFLLGPWWESAAWPGLALVLVALAFTLAHGLFAYLVLLSPVARSLGTPVAAVAVALIAGLALFPPLVVVPWAWGAALAVAMAAVGVLLFLLFDLLTVLLASWTAQVLLGALPLMVAPDPFLQLQGWGAVAMALVPLWASLRFLGTGTRFVYRRDDVPPHVRRIAARERQRVELETARRIQSSILPQLPDEVGGVEVAHAYLPASEVGGDFYDLLALEDGRLSVAIGDVAGHGVSSGLVMSMARSALAVQVTFCPEVEAVFATLNRIVYQSARRRLLTTLCYALLDPQRGEMIYGSAGHLYPYRVSRHGELAALESIAYPLGVREHLEVRARRIDLEPGDTLFLSSDGLVEARAPGSDDMFGFERLEASLSRYAGRDAAGLRDGVLLDLGRFAGEGQTRAESDLREDDLTVLVLRLPA